jgi:biopolymer transport protein ExbB/TolQ
MRWALMGRFMKTFLIMMIVIVVVSMVAAQLQLSSWFSQRIGSLEERSRFTQNQIEGLTQRQQSLELARAQLVDRLKRQAAIQAQEAETEDDAPSQINTTINSDLAALDNQMAALDAQQKELDTQLANQLKTTAVSTKTTQVTQAS